MNSWKTLALCAALALSPALASAQSTPGSMTTPSATTPSADQATKPADAQADAYLKERAACDKKDTAGQDACRTAVDQKYNKKPMTAPQGQTSAPKSTY